MSGAASGQGRPRQDPVSCDLCRKKKLKCDREMPCANCRNRGVTCEYQGKRAHRSTNSTAPDQVALLRRENAAIKARLDRLEEFVYSGGSEHDADDRPSKARKVALPENNQAYVSPSTTVSPSSQSEAAKDYSRDVRWLESVGSQENTRLPQLSAPYTIYIVPLQQIIDKTAFGDQHERCIWLPEEAFGMQAFDVYLEQLDPLQHLIHGPTAKEAVRQLYLNLRLGNKAEPNETLLLLAALTSITAYWGLTESTSTVFGSRQTAANVAVFWLRITFDVFEHVRRTASATLETVQASVIMIFMIYHIEGFSPKARHIVYASVTAAKDLGMHRTDDPTFATPEESQAEIIDREMRRRVWWHLASTDWSMSQAGGPHEGTYIVNPKHMRVNKPRNISDEDLASKPADFDRPIFEPTVMAYYLQRIKLAEATRQVADLFCETDANEMTVEGAHQIVDMFQALLAGLPHFMRLDSCHCPDHDKQQPEIMSQRYMANLTIQARRCKVHLPFLLRAAHDSSFVFARDACLQAARAVIAIHQELSQDNGFFWFASSRLCGMLHFYFYAALVLVMDFCVNRDADHDVARKAELQDAFKTLERAKQESRAAGMFFDSLTAILQKHRVRLKNGEQDKCFLNIDNRPQTAHANALLSASNIAPDLSTGADFGDIGNFDFDEMWQSYIDLDTALDPQAWSALVSDIESLYQGAEH